MGVGKNVTSKAVDSIGEGATCEDEVKNDQGFYPIPVSSWLPCPQSGCSSSLPALCVVSGLLLGSRPCCSVLIANCA